MFFADRLYLAHYTLSAMNAIASSGAFCFVLLAFPLTICEITGVFVGRFHGEEKKEMVGRPVWQILWLAVACWPIFMILSRLIAPRIFAPDSLEAIYFVQYLDFAPFQLCSFALMGFFIGLGQTKVITLCTITANIVNVILAPLFIFGAGVIPELGIQGAAIATGLSLGFQTFLLLGLFLQKKYRTEFCTSEIALDLKLVKSMLTLGIPSGVGRAAEGLAHGFFFRIMALAGPLELTCTTIAQSFYLLVVFCIYGISKGVTAVISNLVGANERGEISKTINSAFKVHTILFCLLLSFTFIFSEFILHLTLRGDDIGLLQETQFISTMKITLFWMCLFFLLKGYSWIVVGHLTALGDTKFVMYVNSLTHWVGYIMPIYLLVTLFSVGAVTGWMIVAANSLLVFAIFWKRSSQKTLEGVAPCSIRDR